MKNMTGDGYEIKLRQVFLEGLPNNLNNEDLEAA